MIMVHSNAFELASLVVVAVVVPSATSTIPRIVPGVTEYLPEQEADIFCTTNCSCGGDDAAGGWDG